MVFLVDLNFSIYPYISVYWTFKKIRIWNRVSRFSEIRLSDYFFPNGHLFPFNDPIQSSSYDNPILCYESIFSPPLFVLY